LSRTMMSSEKDLKRLLEKNVARERFLGLTNPPVEKTDRERGAKTRLWCRKARKVSMHNGLKIESRLGGGDIVTIPQMTVHRHAAKRATKGTSFVPIT